MTTAQAAQANGHVAPEEIDRVRELILGPDRGQSRLQPAEVDRLRTIILGAQMEEYNRHIADLHHGFERVQRDLSGLHERLVNAEQSQLRRADDLEQHARRTGDELRSLIERQRGRDEQLQGAQAKIQQHERARQALATQTSDLRAQQERQSGETRALHALVTDYRDASERQGQNLKRELRLTDKALRVEFRRIADRLEHQKTDRKALAAMLSEVAARLESGDSMTGVLEALSRSSE